MSRDPLLDPKAAAECIGAAVNQLESMRAQGAGPDHISVGACIHYRKSACLEWLDWESV